MQIGDNVYMDIRIKDESRKRVALSYDNMKDFQLVETAGTSLPYICFSFFTFDKNLAEYFMENNEIEISIGETAEKSDKFVIRPILDAKDTDPSDNSWTVSMGGFIGDPSFMMDKERCKSYNGNSLMVAQQLLKDFNGMGSPIDTNIEKVKENQVVWRQIYDVSNVFLVDTLLHMDIRPSFPVFAFDKYKKFHIKDFKKLKKGDPAWKFVPRTANAGNEIQYVNNYNVENYKLSYNLYSGYDKVTEVYGGLSGLAEYEIAENTPLLASTKKSERESLGNRVSLNKIQSGNVHKTYEASYAHNSNRLMAMSSMLGCVQLMGYYPKLKPTDLVYVETGKGQGSDATLEGYYIIDTIVVSPNFRNGVVNTYVYVSRDNKNSVENFIAKKKKKKVNMTKKMIQNLVNTVSRLRVALATCSQIMDGTFLKNCMSFAIASKNNLLKMFSLGGVGLDFTAQARMIQSFLCSGNAIMNALMSMLFPAEIAYTLRDFLIDRPSSRELVSKYIDEYVPFEIQGLVSALVDSLMDVNDSLNSIAEANGITAREIPEVPKDNTPFEETESLISNILQDFENNTTGLDIPFPIVTLTESQELLPEKEVRDLIADKTIANLTDLGYMSGVNSQTFKDILLGNTPINFDIINKINANAGDKLNYRYWGTYGANGETLYAWAYGNSIVYTKSSELTVYTRLYNYDYSPYVGSSFKLEEDGSLYKVVYVDFDGTHDTERNEKEDINTNVLAQLTNFYITKGYKDKYRTIPCTKLISAIGNSKLYFACPQTETNLKFYINSKRVTLKSFPIDLGFVDVYGNKILYDVYYTEEGYNSNSTVLEIRQ